MTPASIRRLEVHGSNPERSRELKDQLRQTFGIYGVQLVELQGVADQMKIRYGDASMNYDGDDPELLSAFITDFMALEVDQLSCRDDAAVLDKYRNSNSTLNIYEDPRKWVKTNLMISKLIAAQPSIGNVIDFLCEQRGLFIKPPKYKLQGTYWNSTSNGGLPIVRKKDEIHEGTFMLHDLFHMVIQDPLPYADNAEPGSVVPRRNFVSHRMASEAMTMVLADMHGVHTAGLEEEGYDTSKRRIYPVYKDILAARGPINVYDVVSANIDFCFTGEVDSLTSLGASQETVAEFTGKYDTFFSADYDWNDHNYVKCSGALLENAAMRNYYDTAKSVFGLPMINDIYTDEITKDEIIASFISQLEEAQNYQAHNDEVKRMKEVARRFYGGQLAIFYNGEIPQLTDSDEHRRYISLGRRIMQAASPEEIHALSEEINALLNEIITVAQYKGYLDPQAAALYRMHVPLYPAFFINYQQERESIIPLQRKIALIDERLS